ncbi:MAG: trypsin-like peptidase domain-containing protein [bacterium]|nr:trypsin-like peptidase domain-containing protein [bacterium]
MSRCPVLSRTVVLLALLACGSLGVSVERPSIEDSVDAMAFVRVHRTFMGRPLVTGGAGVFVHPEGFILTDLQVVDDEVLVPLWADAPEIHAPVVDLEVVIRDAAGRARSYDADIVRVDRKRRLALLKADYRVSDFVGFTDEMRRSLAGEVYVAGFMFAGVNRTGGIVSEGGPEQSLVEFSDGFFESRLKDGESDSGVVLDEGHCGGMIVDASGLFLGIAVCEVQGEERIGAGISLRKAREFYYQSMFVADFDPGVVLKPPQPIAVSVTPRGDLPKTQSWQARLDLLASEEELVTLPLVREDDVWSGSVEISNLALPPTVIERFTARIEVFDQTGLTRFSRLVGLDVVPGALDGLQPKRGILIEESETLEAEEEATSTAKPTLSDVARRTSIASGDDARVIDSSNFRGAEVRIIEPEPPDENRYLALDNVQRRETARKYDFVLAEIAAAKETLTQLEKQKDDLAVDVYDELRQQLLSKLKSRNQTAQRRHKELIRFRLCLCDSLTWHYCYDAPCTEPSVPEVPAR